MSVYQIQINDAIIAEQIGNILDHILDIVLKSRYSHSDKEISEAVKELVYSRKDEIIEMVVNRAVKEISKKALPKLMERLG